MTTVMTQAEFLKTEAPPSEKAVAAKFVSQPGLLRVMPFETRPQPYVPFNRTAALPTTTNRAVGETYTASQGVVDPGFEAMKIQGGISPFDAFQVATGDNRRRTEAANFIDSVGRNFVRDVIKGDDSSDPRIIRGLQLRCATSGTNLVTQSAGACTVIQMNRAIELCENPTHILMGTLMKTRFNVAASNTAVGGYITRGEDQFGSPVTFFADLPIIPVDRDAADARILGFTEASSTTSIYVVSLGAESMHGIQVAPARAEDLGRDPSNGTRYNTVIDWYASFILRRERSAVRYENITDVAITL